MPHDQWSATGVGLAASYECCRRLHRAHGRTYYLATLLLPAWKRRHVHALYGFTRYTDDLVDEVTDSTVAQRAQRLRAWTARFTAALDGAAIDDPILPAIRHTIAVFGLERADFTAFLHSMAMDLTVAGYATYDDLLEYMDGSAAAIGTMMLPILGARDLAAAREPARQLGLAFQLTSCPRRPAGCTGYARPPRPSCCTSAVPSPTAGSPTTICTSVGCGGAPSRRSSTTVG